MERDLFINYNSAGALSGFLASEGLGMQKKFGQNFLLNPQIRRTLAQALDCKAASEVWEIGAGLGAMTTLLLERGLIVRAFEIDAGFIRILKRLFADEKNFSLIEGDVMKTWNTMPDLENENKFLLGNLPYNIAAALLADFIEKGCLFSRMVVTVQKETALRMAARAGSPNYSSFSVLCASAYKVKPLMTIRPQSFYPKPKVESMGVLLERRHYGCEKIPKVFFPLVRSLFASRRKTIKNNLMSLFQNSVEPKNLCAQILYENGLSGNERAEDMEIDIFLSLAKSIENMRIYNSDVNSREY